MLDEQKPTIKQEISGNTIEPLRVDYKMARNWVHYCRTHHKGYCKLQGPIKEHTVAGFKLIDCKTRRIVPGSQEFEYVALSYVWGENSARTSIRLLPNPAPRTIEDAIIATTNLGFRYLWIDRYCISQIDPSEKHHQIARMDRIYADAIVTIVAAAGEDPHYGLPGVSRTHRHPQPSAVIGKQQLVSSLRSPRDVIMSSKWASRGWTFQEAKLSRRAIFFTDDQIFFEC
ncbi:HET-domain-containing protein, partial [Corynespora cassiicola Philippines]